jgi:transposase
MTIEQEFASPSSNTQTVYAAIELSKKNWVISVAHPDQRKPSIYRLPGGDFDALVACFGKSRTAIPVSRGQ